ncbi:hypothetical protein L6452_08727 [Arctium lappa]|uniref:Uncharacterized protein n=1 Tax=Arctium lappa TaxID=4217 RepID=A0ACB9DII1_ARCLA|nr:hypothetical protein L6452_08727 [Arctium lappa]
MVAVWSSPSESKSEGFDAKGGERGGERAVVGREDGGGGKVGFAGDGCWPLSLSIEESDKSMMGHENQGFEDAQIYASREEMESLVLDDDDNNNSGNVNNPSSRSNGGANGGGIQHQHPLSSALRFAEIPTIDDDDPLLSSSSP